MEENRKKDNKAKVIIVGIVTLSAGLFIKGLIDTVKIYTREYDEEEKA
jgi:hypothetical protein